MTAAHRGERGEPQSALLGRLATALNAARRGKVGADEAQALRLVEEIITLPTTAPAAGAEAVYGMRLSPAAARFNEVAAGVPVVLRVVQHIRPGAAGALASPASRPVSPEHRDLALWLWVLQEAFFWRAGWRRLKRCAVCGRWFVRTRNTRQERCSLACTRAYWSSARRRAAGHVGFAPRKPKKGK